MAFTLLERRGAQRYDPAHLLAMPRDPDAELVELAALIESDDTSPDALEHIEKLMGRSDPNYD